jgi:hypothetical protein
MLSQDEERNSNLLNGLNSLEQQYKNAPPPNLEFTDSIENQPVAPDSPNSLPLDSDIIQQPMPVDTQKK